jgi:hypothetical protein
MRFLVSTRKGLFLVEKANQRWLSKCVGFLGDNVTLTLPIKQDQTKQTWFAALNLGHFGVKLKSSSDEGQTWNECSVPEYPAGETLTTMDGKPPVPATLKLIWSLEANQQGRIWAGTAPGGLFHSDDLGSTWTLNRKLWDEPARSQWLGGGYDWPGIHSIMIDPRNSKTIRLGISSGGVWRSDDNGETWIVKSEGLFAEYMPTDQRFNPSIQDAHRVVQCSGSPDHLWLQHHNGIFRSKDDGETWQHCEHAKPTGFGFAVAVHPHQPNTAWFVPAVKDECRVPKDGKLVVSRTTDGGQTFEILGNGLPQEPCYDIAYRHALDVDQTGNVLAFGTTTGGFWISENSGESWIQLASRLPPIHAVRVV